MEKPSIQKVSAGGVVIDDGKVLTISSTKRGGFNLPKGTVDPGETLEKAAVREVKEETGYDVVIDERINSYTFEFDWDDGNHYVKTVTYYRMSLANNNPPVQNLQEGEDFIVEWLEPQVALDRLLFEEARDAVRLALKSSSR